ncbi:Rieske (2Fe-2S) protein [Roseomonas sp. BN140053]|uniref:Rieske (2Fe-2S) protein n=1 Tax=Roseomonas sp. BN140053 TaxID=3391898 RepID=UPI0039EBAD65
MLVYVNSCPHLGLPLEPLPDRFLDRSGTAVVCSTHGARFRVADGFCVSGPCTGDSLERVPAELRDGVILVPETAGL